MKRPAWHAAEGYTLVETTVALLLALVLGAVLYAFYLAVTRGVAPWQREAALQDQAHLLSRRVAADLAYARQLIATDDGWAVVDGAGRAVRYGYRDGVLTRDGRPMHDASLSVAAFRLTPSRAETRFALPRRVAGGEDERSLISVAVHLAVRSRARTLVLTTTVAPRPHRPWPPMP